jgi:hypothetical protein
MFATSITTHTSHRRTSVVATLVATAAVMSGAMHAEHERRAMTDPPVVQQVSPPSSLDTLAALAGTSTGSVR